MSTTGEKRGIVAGGQEPTDGNSSSSAGIGEVVAQESNAKKPRYDATTEFIKRHPEFADYTPAEERKARWKVDRITFPLRVTTMIAAVDKIVISNVNSTDWQMTHIS